MKTPHFQNETKYTASLVKMSLISHENENHSHKAEHLTSSWYRGPGELRNGLLVFPPFGVPRFANDADGNENVKKTIGFISKTTTLHVHHAFLYISLPVFARLRRENA